MESIYNSADEEAQIIEQKPQPIFSNMNLISEV